VAAGEAEVASEAARVATPEAEDSAPSAEAAAEAVGPLGVGRSMKNRRPCDG
jgi:hypothetical protein